MSTSRWVCRARCALWCPILIGFVVAGCMPPASEDEAPRRSSSSGEEQKSLMHRFTREVKDANKELGTAGTQEAKPRLPETNVIRYPFDAAIDTRAKIAKIQIQAAVNNYWALNGRYPKDYNEFKREILDANPTMQLPALPYYQEYGYDTEKHELIILEYPDRKKTGRQK
jgi:hypothetical protein